MLAGMLMAACFSVESEKGLLVAFGAFTSALVGCRFSSRPSWVINDFPVASK